jgi:hypothetical protein
MIYSFLALVYMTANVLVFGEPGALDIRVHPGDGELYPPAQLLVQDPSGRKCGTNPKDNVSFAGIPLASYEAERIDDDETGARGPETRILYLPQTDFGEYRLSVIGTDSGAYSLEIRNFRDEIGSGPAFLFHGTISPGEVDEYQILVGQDGIGATSVITDADSP